MMVIIILISPATMAEVAALLGKAEEATTPAGVMTPAAVVVAMLANLERPVVPVAVVALLANLLERPVTLALANPGSLTYEAVANPGSLTYEARATVDPGWSCWPYVLIFMSKARKSSSLTADEARSSIGKRKEKRRQNRYTYIMSY